MIYIDTIKRYVKVRVNEAWGTSNAFHSDTVLGDLIGDAVMRYIDDLGGVPAKLGIGLVSGISTYKPGNYLFGYTGIDIPADKQTFAQEITGILGAEYKGRPLRLITEPWQKRNLVWFSGPPIAIEWNRHGSSFTVFPTPSETSKENTTSAVFDPRGIENTANADSMSLNDSSGFSSSGYVGVTTANRQQSALVRYSGVSGNSLTGCSLESVYYTTTFAIGSVVKECPITIEVLMNKRFSQDQGENVYPLRAGDIPTVSDLVCSLLYERSGEFSKAKYYMDRYLLSMRENKARRLNTYHSGKPLFGYEYPEL